MSRNYKFHNKSGLYFVSFATVNWIDVFTRHPYFDVLGESVKYCREKKGMELYCYCFMPSHVHFIFRSTNEQPSGLLRDFKRHTSKRVLEAIENNPQESRKEWLLWMFERAGKKNAATSKYQFWQHHNKPIELWSDKVIKQKIDYIHNNPVEAGFVTNPIDWKYSSARNYQEDHTILEIDSTGFLG
ncbi:transposase [Subsaximicrobium wynnwilliamsii]|uniref:Transposase n=1 Tax=Subsaximicrobium wynnwilliamsii TaxID=291179 RepID=A0A5C6ZHQ5_9FLAO|nr:transposase [Subsaximicrobium wynnwilliamsii]TXD83437.1 transposase [Subsaximicrobium wynnwilliamsii]TXD89288.1 transposase [Subsaximicrobium wynnwilliamsii]TXE03117.1 transposase [Subsaximicrobium wynnwilliamsii]